MIKTVQREGYRLLLFLADLCERNNIDYFLDGGTFLGAIRHQGFIPWDDDVDVGLFRKDYERLDELLLNNQYFLDNGDDIFYQSFRTSKHYPMEFSKIRNKNIPVKEIVPELLNDYVGPWVDIFPYDNIADDEKLALKQFNQINRVNKILKWLIFSEEKPADSLKNKVHNFFHRFNQRFNKYYFFIPALMRYRRRQMKKYNDVKTKRVACFGYHRYDDFEDFQKSIFLRSNLEDRKKFKFEGGEFWAPRAYDRVLSRMYGDYMTYPEKSQQKAHNVVFK